MPWRRVGRVQVLPGSKDGESVADGAHAELQQVFAGKEAQGAPVNVVLAKAWYVHGKGGVSRLEPVADGLDTPRVEWRDAGWGGQSSPAHHAATVEVRAWRPLRRRCGLRGG